MTRLHSGRPCFPCTSGHPSSAKMEHPDKFFLNHEQNSGGKNTLHNFRAHAFIEPMEPFIANHLKDSVQCT